MWYSEAELKKTRQQLKNTLLLNAYRLRSFAFKKKTKLDAIINRSII